MIVNKRSKITAFYGRLTHKTISPNIESMLDLQLKIYFH
jgi:hypothetical protein